MSEEQANGDSPAGETEAATDRAERLVEDWAEQLGDWGSRVIARAREEAEDLWAEAQSVRRGE